MNIKLGFLILPITLLPGCAAVSFGPPNVNIGSQMTSYGRVWKMPTCRSNYKTDDKGKFVTINPNVNGARALIDNFLLSYRCAVQSAANGHQAFELPALIAALGAPAVAAFGGNPDATIFAGVAAATLNAGKGFYNPKQKANILNAAVDAITCIKTEAVGISAFDIKLASVDDPKTTPKLQPKPKDTEAAEGAAEGVEAEGVKGGKKEKKSGIEALAEALSDPAAKKTPPISVKAAVLPALTTDDSNDPVVAISYQHQYFDLVASALFSVERVLAHRLNNEIAFDPAGVIAEIEKLKGETEEAEKETPKVEPSNEQAYKGILQRGVSVGVLTQTESDAVFTNMVRSSMIKVKQLQPKLQTCVVRAKL